MNVAFGSGLLPVSLPAGLDADLFVPRAVTAAAAPSDITVHAIDHPIGTAPLRQLARGRRSAAVIVPDGTRALPFRDILPPILQTLEKEIRRDEIVLVFATGMHRPVSAEEAEQLLGPDITENYRSESHDAGIVQAIGKTKRGTPVSVNPTCMKADLKLVVGLVEPHLLAGYSGGRKMIAPGVIGLDAMPILHGPRLIGHPDARIGNLTGNPVHEEALEIARMVGVDFAVHAGITEGGELSSVLAGDLYSSHIEAARRVRESSRVPAYRRYPIVITSGGGAPLDATLYQSIKGAIAALPILEDNGTILLIAECAEGWGSFDFLELLERLPDHDSFLDWAGGSFQKDQWMVQHLREAQRTARILVHTPARHSPELQSLGIERADNLGSTIDSIVGEINPDRIALLPRGPYTWVDLETAGS